MLAGSKQRQFWMAGIAAASFGISLLILFGYKEWAFYSPISRAWELLAGGIVADRWIDAPELKRRSLVQLDDLLATAGMAAIAGAAIGLDKQSLFPGISALAPVLGAVLIIVSPNSHVNRILLSNRPMVLIGLISYPLYLWHWPLLSYLDAIRHGLPTSQEVWAVVIVAFILSWLTYRLIELPVRRSTHFVPRLSFGLTAIGVVGVVTVIASGFGFRFPPEVRDIAQIKVSSNSIFRDKCFLLAKAPGSRFNADCIEPGEKPLLFVWGDSTAAALHPGLKTAEETVPFRLARFTTAACVPILAMGAIGRCDEANDNTFGFVKSSAPAIVLLHSLWDMNDDDLNKLGETIQQLRAINVPRIVILGPVPTWKRPLPHSLVNFYRFRHMVTDRIATGVSGPENDRRMETFSKAAGVEYISAWHTLCNKDGCMTRVGPTANDIITIDKVHLSDAGSRFLIKTISDRLFHTAEGKKLNTDP